MNELLKMEYDEIEDIMERAELTEKFTDDRFKIESVEQANWAFRKLRAISVKSSEIKELADSERARIEEWEKKELLSMENSKGFFEGLLIEYFAKQRQNDPKFKLSTPYGKVSARKQQPKWEYDEVKLLEWLKENKPELVRIKEEPNKADLKKQCKVVGDTAVDENGEIVEGVSVTEQGEKIDIKVVE